jgi:hypothetical protein
MTTFLDTESHLDQLDHELRELTREHRPPIVDPDPFSRYLDTANERSAGHLAPPANAPTAGRIESQLRHELNLAFSDLGGAAFALAHHGALNDKRLAAHVQRIHELYAQLDAIAHAA